MPQGPCHECDVALAETERFSDRTIREAAYLAMRGREGGYAWGVPAVTLTNGA
jgi:hypothetical protein